MQITFEIRGPVEEPYLRVYQKNVLGMLRPGRADEVAAMVSYLASDESAYVTGAAFTIDGGFGI